MLKIKYIFGAIDGTVDLDPALLVGDVSAFQANATVQGLKGGRLATIGSDGYARLAVDGDLFAGFIVNDAAGYSFENVPALGSGKLPILIGGGVVETDQVIQDDIAPGDELWIGADGKLTNVDPTTGPAIAIARSGNSAADLTITVQF